MKQSVQTEGSFFNVNLQLITLLLITLLITLSLTFHLTELEK